MIAFFLIYYYVDQHVKAMEIKLIAQVKTVINAPIEKVWEALVNPEIIKEYMFGTTVVSDWKEGSQIVWKGEWKGKAYEDKGTILQFNERSILQYSHFSPLTGKPDLPENYHVVTITLTALKKGVEVELTQDNNETEKEQKHSEDNWNTMLEGLKKFLENKVSA